MGWILNKILARKLRSSWGKNDRQRCCNFVSPENIVRCNDICYGNDKKYGKWQLLDVYKPKTAKEKIPVIVSVHGGSWIYGDKDVYQFYCMNLADRGFAVVNFSYRLAPEKKFPTAIEDIDTVFQWICNNSAEYGFDTENIFAVGDSAGAHLLSVYLAALTNPDYGKNFSFISAKKRFFTINAVALNCGIYEMEIAAKVSFMMRRLLKMMLNRSTFKKDFKLLNVCKYVTKDFPPTFVMTCYGDFLKDQAPFMIAPLLLAHVDNEFHCYGDEKKSLWHVFHCDINLPEAVLCNDEECNFFKRFIKGQMSNFYKSGG